MAVYHQMGYDSQNLLAESDFSLYRGAVLSPVNEDEMHMQSIIEQHRADDFEMIIHFYSVGFFTIYNFPLKNFSDS